MFRIDIVVCNVHSGFERGTKLNFDNTSTLNEEGIWNWSPKAERQLAVFSDS